MSRPARVLSVMGPGRSGTTVLGAVLGEVEGIADLGEVRWIWQRGLLERRRCGCGVPLPECPFWSVVIQRASAGLPRPLRAEEVVEVQRRLGRRSSRRAVIKAADGSVAASDDVAGYADVAGRLYAAAAEVSGARLLVDTSKRAIDAAIANRVVGERHYVLHIVRDPRAVAYSWQRLKANPSSDAAPLLSRRTALASAGRWTENALGAEALRRRVPLHRQLFVRYEDFARQPRECLQAVLALLGVDAPSPVGTDGTVDLGRNHTVAGNPDRFRTGPVAIREDVAWRTGLSRQDRLVVQTVTLPFLRRYGYSVRVGG